MRLIPSIKDMAPTQILRRRPFSVPIPTGVEGGGPIINPGQVYAVPLDNVKRQLKTQSDFVREFYPSSHAINEIKYYPNTLYKSKDGKYQAKVRSRIAVAFQQYIHLQRKEALLGNNVGMRLVSDATSKKNIDLLARYREGWEDKDIEVAINKAIDKAFATGDCAVNIYMDGGKVGWRTFSFSDGDELYPQYDSMTGEMALFGRLYNAQDWDGEGRQYLDVWDKEFFVTYVNDADGEGWRMEGTPQPHGFPFCPIAYHRCETGPVWSASQGLIDGYEIALSQFAENNAAYALRILYTLGGDFEIMSNVDGTPARIDSIDPNAKVGFLEPAAGADGAFAKQLEIMKKEILRGSFVVETPEIKSGADISSRTVKMLFADSYMKALSDSMEYQPFINRVAYLFKFGYFVETGRVSEADSLKIKTYLDPFIFLSDNDIVTAVQQLVTINCLSRKTATEILSNIGYSSPDEYARLLQQDHDELVAGSAASAQTQQTVQNPVAASRLNNA